MELNLIFLQGLVRNEGSRNNQHYKTLQCYSLRQLYCTVVRYLRQLVVSGKSRHGCRKQLNIISLHPISIHNSLKLDLPNSMLKVLTSNLSSFEHPTTTSPKQTCIRLEPPKIIGRVRIPNTPKQHSTRKAGNNYGFRSKSVFTIDLNLQSEKLN